MLFYPLPSSAWADGKLAKLAEQVDNEVEHSKSKSHPSPGPPADGPPCIWPRILLFFKSVCALDTLQVQSRASSCSKGYFVKCSLRFQHADRYCFGSLAPANIGPTAGEQPVTHIRTLGCIRKAAGLNSRISELILILFISWLM